MKAIKNEKYKKFVHSNMPKSEHLSTMLRAFIVGGTICSIGEGFKLMYMGFFPMLQEKMVHSLVLMTLITLTGILTGLGIYDKIGNFGGAGSIVPITGFANSVVSPAIEHKREGVVLGLCGNMFTIAGPVIVFGITSSVIVGLIFLIIGG